MNNKNKNNIFYKPELNYEKSYETEGRINSSIIGENNQVSENIIDEFNNTINNVLDYGEDLEKSTNGLKRIFIECHEMLQAENSNMFIQSVGGSLFRVLKFLKGNRENVKCLIVLKNEHEKFIAMDENYTRQDETVTEDEKFLYIKNNDKDITSG